MLSWKIYESSHGGYIAELASDPVKNQLAGYCPGFLMGRIVYDQSHFDTREQAENYIHRKTNGNQ